MPKKKSRQTAGTSGHTRKKSNRKAVPLDLSTNTITDNTTNSPSNELYDTNEEWMLQQAIEASSQLSSTSQEVNLDAIDVEEQKKLWEQFQQAQEQTPHTTSVITTSSSLVPQSIDTSSNVNYKQDFQQEQQQQYDDYHNHQQQEQIHNDQENSTSGNHQQELQQDQTLHHFDKTHANQEQQEQQQTHEFDNSTNENTMSDYELAKLLQEEENFQNSVVIGGDHQLPRRLTPYDEMDRLEEQLEEEDAYSDEEQHSRQFDSQPQFIMKRGKYVHSDQYSTNDDIQYEVSNQDSRSAKTQNRHNLLLDDETSNLGLGGNHVRELEAADEKIRNHRNFRDVSAETHSKRRNKKQMYTKMKQVDKQDIATSEKVLDHRTQLILHKFINNGILQQIHGVISAGKESHIFHAQGKIPLDTLKSMFYKDRRLAPDAQNSQFFNILKMMEKQQVKELDNISQEFINNENQLLQRDMSFVVKIFKTVGMSFRRREKYQSSEHRFKDFTSSSSSSAKNTQKSIRKWAEKEMRNLKRLVSVGVPAPVPIVLKDHVIVMSFIGKSFIPAPLLHDLNLNIHRLQDIYFQIIREMRRMYQDAHLIHSDLSEYNILYYKKQIYFIDTSQGVETDHVNAKFFLRKDCQHIHEFFFKRGVLNILTDRELFEYIIFVNKHDEHQGYQQNKTTDLASQNQEKHKIQDDNEDSEHVENQVSNHELEQVSSTSQDNTEEQLLEQHRKIALSRPITSLDQSQDEQWFTQVTLPKSKATTPFNTSLENAEITLDTPSSLSIN